MILQAGDVENRQISSALSAMKERYKALDILRQRVMSLPESQISQAVRDSLTQCSTADEVLLLLKTTYQEVETHKERLAAAAQTLATLTNRLQQTRAALQESQVGFPIHC